MGDQHQPATRGQDEQRPAIARIASSLDVVERLEIADQLAHRLLRHPGLAGQIGAPSTAALEVHQQREMARPDVTVAEADKPVLDLPIDRSDRV